VQSNVSSSSQGVLRGLHYQWPNPQGKLVSVLEGEVYDVAVDIRRGSPHFGQWAAVVLSAENKRQFWIPEGFAHGLPCCPSGRCSATCARPCTTRRRCRRALERPGHRRGLAGGRAAAVGQGHPRTAAGRVAEDRLPVFAA
jgi:hypothetical protein